MKFIVPIKILRAANIAAPKDDIRFYLNGIRFIKNRVESTNGHIAYMAICNQDLPEWFDGDVKFSDVIINIAHKIPASTKRNNIQYAVIESDTEESVIIRYMDFCGQQLAIGQGNIVDGKFPNLPKLLANTRKQGKVMENDIGFNAKYMAIPSKMLAGESFPVVKFEMFGDKTAGIATLIRPSWLDVKEVLLIMPANLNQL